MVFSGRLPQELTDMVIGYVQDKPSCKQCALTCRSWVRSSQRYLFHDITIRVAGEFFSNSPACRLIGVLLRSPYIAQYVRGISIAFCDEIPDHTFFQQELVAIILPLFQRLTRISLETSFENEFDIIHTLEKALHEVLLSPQLEHVALNGRWPFPNPASSVGVMGSELKSLTSLALRGIYTPSFALPAGMERVKEPRVTVQSLIIACVGSLENLAGWFSTSRHPVDVKKLRIERGVNASPLIVLFASSLEELHFHLPPEDFEFTDLGPLTRLSKLSIVFYPGILGTVATIRRGNCLESLEIEASFMDFIDNSDSIGQLDQLLVSDCFARLQSVTIAMPTNSLTSREFNSIRKSMHLSIDRGILQLLFETKELLDSEQIQAQAMAHAADLSCFIDISEEEQKYLLPPFQHPLAANQLPEDCNRATPLTFEPTESSSAANVALPSNFPAPDFIKGGVNFLRTHEA